MLAEMSICIGDYDKAIAAAKRVIDGTDGDYHLMTERFGTRAGEATDRYGNPHSSYWDLFVWVILIIRKEIKKQSG